MFAVHSRQTIRREATARSDRRVARAAWQETRDYREVGKKWRTIISEATKEIRTIKSGVRRILYN